MLERLKSRRTSRYLVYTDALYEASKGYAAADNKQYEDAWGTFYSAYSPVFDSDGKVAGIRTALYGIRSVRTYIAGTSRAFAVPYL